MSAFQVGQKVEVKVAGRVIACSSAAPHDYIVLLDVPDTTVYRIEEDLAAMPGDNCGADI